MVIAAFSILGYLSLLAVALRRGYRRPESIWAAIYITTSIALALFLAGEQQGWFARLQPAVSPGRVFASLHLLGAGLFGAVTVAYLDRRRAWIMALAGVAATAAMLALDATSPGPGLRHAAWLQSLTFRPPAPGAIVAVGLYLLINLIIFGLTFQSMRIARLPLHANRALLWLIAVIPTLLIGDAAVAWGSPIIRVLGQGLRLAGTAGAVYAWPAPVWATRSSCCSPWS
jgi:hypothetical protein